MYSWSSRCCAFERHLVAQYTAMDTLESDGLVRVEGDIVVDAGAEIFPRESAAFSNVSVSQVSGLPAVARSARRRCCVSL